jgi:multiple sugar transport system ATP-binding protein
MTLADKIVVLRAGEVMQVGSPLELYHHPANQFVAGFLGSPKMNFLEVDVREVGTAAVTVSSPALEPVAIPRAIGSFRPGAKAVLGVRPQFLHPGQFADRGHLHGRVSLVERLGTETVTNVELTAGGRIVVSLDGDHPFDLGAELLVGFEPERAHLFAAA